MFNAVLRYTKASILIKKKDKVPCYSYLYIEENNYQTHKQMIKNWGFVIIILDKISFYTLFPSKTYNQIPFTPLLVIEAK